MLYHYSASDKNGKLTEADFEADTLNQVLKFLAGRNLRPISVKPVQQREAAFRRIFGGINLTDKIFLTKYLSLMLSVGTDLLSAINILVAEFDKPSVKNFLLEVQDNLSHGQQFYKAFERYPMVFSVTFVSLIKAAEASGTLEKTFADLSTALAREAELRNKVRSALAYPIILLVISLIVVLFLTIFALPRIANVFAESGVTPPAFSRVVFAIGLFMGANTLSIMGILGVLTFGGGYFFWYTELGRRLLGRAFAKFPLTRKVYRELALQRFASSLSSLMRAGLPIVQAVNITAETVGAEEYKFALQRIASEGISKGLTIGDAFRRETVFPRVVTNLIAVSENAGHLDEVLSTIADFYAANIDSDLKTIIALLEPALLLTIGMLVGIIALSIILPIYQLTSSLSV